MNHAPTTVVGLALMGGLHCGGAPPEDGELLAISSGVSEDRSAETRGDVHDDAQQAGASVNVPDGSRFLVGTFTGALRAGDHVLRSRGGQDIYLVHLFSGGEVDWATSVGSRGEETSPRIDFDDGRLKLVAMTNGAVDCGNGPLRTFATETFFVCTFDARGTVLSGGAFPTGRP